jgi:tetratricopeptide (TPR) repeat protein
MKNYFILIIIIVVCIPHYLFAGSYKDSVITLAVNSEQWITGEKSSPESKSGSSPAEKKDTKLSLEEQENLAKELYGKMAGTDEWDTETFIKLHRHVIEQCPDTRWAQESLWRLSNLYLLAKDPPDYLKIIKLMEELISKYPGSLFCPDAKNRLMIAYEQTGNYRKAVILYEDMFERDPGLVGRDEYAAVLLGYAKALSESGNKEKARAIYQKIIDLKDTEDWLKDIARDALSGTEKSESGEKK